MDPKIMEKMVHVKRLLAELEEIIKDGLEENPDDCTEKPAIDLVQDAVELYSVYLEEGQ